MEPRSPALQADSLPAEPQGSPRILEWVAYPFSSGSSWPRNWTRFSWITGGFFTNWASREALLVRCVKSRLGTGRWCCPAVSAINQFYNLNKPHKLPGVCRPRGWTSPGLPSGLCSALWFSLWCSCKKRHLKRRHVQPSVKRFWSVDCCYLFNWMEFVHVVHIGLLLFFPSCIPKWFLKLWFITEQHGQFVLIQCLLSLGFQKHNAMFNSSGPFVLKASVHLESICQPFGNSPAFIILLRWNKRPNKTICTCGSHAPRWAPILASWFSYLHAVPFHTVTVSLCDQWWMAEVVFITSKIGLQKSAAAAKSLQ